MNKTEEKIAYLKQYRIQQAKIRRLEDMMELCGDKADYYRQKQKECIQFRDRIEGRIDRVDGGILSEILSQKYICGRSFEQISILLNYSKRQIERLHLRAIEKFCLEQPV